MANKRPFKKVAGAISGGDSSTIWTVDWWKSESTFMFWVAHDRSGKHYRLPTAEFANGFLYC